MTEKLKVYLDTNIIYGLFKRILQSIFEEKDFTIPYKIRIIHDNPDKIESFTSFFTLIEIIEELKKCAKKRKRTLTSEQIYGMITFFKENFHVEILRSIWITEKAVQYVLSGIEWKDAIQLEIARANDYTLVTDDKNLRKIGKKFYDSIMNFNELKRRFASSEASE